MTEKITLEAFYPDPPERVWRALTDSSAVSRWLMPTTFRAELGFRFRFEGISRGNSNTVEGVVLEADKPHKLTYTWDDGHDDMPGVVSWTLEPKDGGTHLTLHHSPLEGTNVASMIEASQNWQNALEVSLPVVLYAMKISDRRPPVPMVYVQEGPEPDGQSRRRAGFRQEEITCK